MREAVIHVHPSGPLLALVGNPNCGKTALFNRLTGSHQKVANYAGVTVERKEGRLHSASGRALRLLDLPGTYSLHPRSPDERVTCDVLAGRARGEKRPDLVVCVLDATNLRRTLRLVLAVKRLQLPCVVVLNMADLAAKRGIEVNTEELSAALGVPVVRTVATRGEGIDALKALLDQREVWAPASQALPDLNLDNQPDTDHAQVKQILQSLGLDRQLPHLPSDRVDRVLLHPVMGPLIMTAILFLLF